jgi:hypothetical protein
LLLPAFSKIFEKILYKRLYQHLNTNNILTKEQFGFRCNTSTETAIYALINNTVSSLNNKLMVGRLSCDLQKAFDCVNHDILLSKMKFYGITDIANKLIESYLRKRYQRVVINDDRLNKYHSEWEHIHHGVPQGSILKPLFFLLYINDLPKSVSDKSNPILFADDTSFIITNCNKAEFKDDIYDIFSEINKWFRSNLLSLNYDKTYLLQLVTKNNQEIDTQISLNKKKITTTQSIKFLGLTIDASLTWKYNINELTPRLNKACFAIRSVRPFMSLDILRSTYFLYVHSIISYGKYFGGIHLTVKTFLKFRKE